MTYAPRSPLSTPRPAATTHPPVSVIMPVRNEERHLAEAVRSVLAQDYPAPIEVVLAVGPSKDATHQIADGLAATDPRVRVVPNPSGLIPCANNAAIKASQYPIIARVDGHAVLPPGYLQQAVSTLRNTGADDVGGVMAAEGVTPFERAVAWAMTSPWGVGRAKFHTGGEPGPADSVYLGVYRRATLEKVGGYDESYLRAEDWEMNHRIRLAGGLIYFQPGMRVTYRPRGSVRALASQYFHYGRWRRVVARQHPHTINLRYLAPPAVALAILLGLVSGALGLGVGIAGPWPAWRWLTAGLAIPALYLAGTAAVMTAALRSLPSGIAARLPVVLATMHIAWGLGFLTSPRDLMPARGGKDPRRRVPRQR